MERIIKTSDLDGIEAGLDLDVELNRLLKCKMCGRLVGVCVFI